LAVGDICLAFVQATSGNPATPSGWTLCAGCPTSTAAPFYNVYWQRASAAGTLSFSATQSGQITAVIAAYSGCVASGDPTEAGAGQQNASSTTVNIPAITTLGTNRLVVLSGYAAASPQSSIVNATLSGLATRESVEPQMGDGSLASAASSGASSFTVASAVASASHAIALVPASTTPGLAGTADLAFTATATGSLIGALIGNAGLALATSAVIAAAGALSGSANLSLAATGTATGTGALVGTSNLALTASAAPQATGALAGSSNLTFTASGTATNSFNLGGAANLSFTATATPQAQAAIAGTAPLAFIATATPAAVGKLAGASPLAFSSAGTLNGIGSLAGDASLLWTASGSPTSIISIGGEADLSFTASATPEVGYAPDGRYYVALPVRPFYASLPPRSFYAQLPARSFYILSDPNMTPIFDTKDPRETVVLTFDATADLPTGVTLTSIISTQITMQRGDDPAKDQVVTGALINSTQVVLGTVTIAANHCVQAIAQVGLNSCWYLAAITCATSDPNLILTLKGILPVSSS